MDSVETIINFFLCFIRFVGVLMMTPLISSSNFPVKAKTFMAFLVSLSIFFTVPISTFVPVVDDTTLFIIGVKEFAVGVLIGLNVALVNEVLTFSGSIISTPMGLSIATAVDPSSGEGSTTMGQFNATLATFLFLVIDGHHYVFLAYQYSYQVIPLGNFSFEITGIPILIQTFYKIFLIAVQISLPILAPLFMINFALGVLARTMPKLNIFMVGIPLQIVVGMVTYMIILPFMVNLIKALYGNAFKDMSSFLEHFV